MDKNLKQPIYDFKIHKDIHVIIEASAGTGKTYTIEKMIPQMIEGGVPIEKIAVLTFTEKAAAELQDRIRKELTRKSKETIGDEKERLENALEILPNANIGTIHHFCRNLIKKHSIHLGLSPKFSEIKNLKDEVEIYFKNFWGRIEKDDSEKLIELLQEIGFTKFKGILIDIVEKTGGKKVKLLNKPNSNTIEGNFKILRSLLNNCNLTDEKPAYKVRLREFQNENVSTSLERIISLKSTFFTGKLTPTESIQKFIVSSNSIDAFEYTKILNDLLLDLENSIALEIINPLFEYANILIEEYEKFLNTQDSISLDGLILKARDLIEIPEIKKEIQKDIQYLILDECQDTNPVQIDLITKLFKGKKAGIILVGDPKQSIYRFRNADLISYSNAIKNLNSKEELPLRKSFRSSAKLIKAFNIIFPKFNNLVNVYKSVEANRAENEFGKEISPPLILLGLDKDNKPKTQDKEGNPYLADNLKAESIDEIVNLIHTITDNENYLIEDKSQAKGRSRKIMLSDIAVLANSNSSLNTILKEFSRQSISANIYKSKTFYSHKIIQAISYLLHAIENPNDSASLYKTLASDLFLVSEGILFQLSEANELSYLFKTKNTEVNFIFESLRKAHENRYMRDVGFTLQEILKENKILEIISLGFEGKRNLANIYHLTESLSFSQLSENLSFGEIVRRLKKDVESSVEQEIKLDNDRKDSSFNSVQLMTLHASKGLEFPVCILFNIASQLKSDSTSLFLTDSSLSQIEQEIELEIKLPSDIKITTPNYKEIYNANREELNKEFDRLLYVGFTRAMDYLVLPLHNLDKPKGNSLRKLIEPAFSPEKIEELLKLKLAENFITLKSSPRKKTNESEILISPNQNAKLQLFSLSHKEMNKKSGIKLQSYSSIARQLEPEEEFVKEKIAFEKNTIAENEDSSPITLSTGKKGTTFGLLCHSIMENFNLNLLNEEEKIKEEIEKFVKELYPTTGLNENKEYTSQDAINICYATLNKSFPMNTENTEYSKIKDWKYLTREKSFYSNLNYENIDFLIGIGDGMFFWKGKYYLLDWKTNLIKPNENESLEEIIQKKVNESYYYQYMIYCMNFIENMELRQDKRKESWEQNFGGMLFIFMRVLENNKGSLLIKPKYEEILEFKKGLKK